jgi:hypothetical protein
MEVQNKVSILGYLGILPYAEIRVTNATLPVPKLTFILVSGTPAHAGKYLVRISVKDPTGKELPIPMHEGVADLADSGPLNMIMAVQPFPLAGPGTYKVTVSVNDKPDLVENMTFSQDSSMTAL